MKKLSLAERIEYSDIVYVSQAILKNDNCEENKYQEGFIVGSYNSDVGKDIPHFVFKNSYGLIEIHEITEDYLVDGVGIYEKDQMYVWQLENGQEYIPALVILKELHYNLLSYAETKKVTNRSKYGLEYSNICLAFEDYIDNIIDESTFFIEEENKDGEKGEHVITINKFSEVTDENVQEIIEDIILLEEHFEKMILNGL